MTENQKLRFVSSIADKRAVGPDFKADWKTLNPHSLGVVCPVFRPEFLFLTVRNKLALRFRPGGLSHVQKEVRQMRRP
jgi:hypothetical protein